MGKILPAKEKEWQTQVVATEVKYGGQVLRPWPVEGGWKPQVAAADMQLGETNIYRTV